MFCLFVELFYMFVDFACCLLDFCCLLIKLFCLLVELVCLFVEFFNLFIEFFQVTRPGGGGWLQACSEVPWGPDPKCPHIDCTNGRMLIPIARCLVAPVNDDAHTHTHTHCAEAVRHNAIGHPVVTWGVPM